MKKKISFILATLLILILVLTVTSLPLILFEKEDEVLFNTEIQRERETHALSPEGEDLYLVRTLYTRAELLRSGGGGYMKKEADFKTVSGQLTPMLTALAKQGTLPTILYDAISALAEKEGCLISYSEDSAGFKEVIFSGDDNIISSFGIELEPRTNTIVNLWINTTEDIEKLIEGFETPLALVSYKKWLELSSLDDWQSEIPSYYKEAQVSRKGKIKLYLQARGKLFQIGVAALITE